MASLYDQFSNVSIVNGPLVVRGLLFESSVDGISAAGNSQGTGTQLWAEFNRITTATANQGVILPPTQAGLDVYIVNHSGVQIIVYGSGSDLVDDIAGSTGVAQMNQSVVLFTSYSAGKWYTNGLATGIAPNTQGTSALQTVQFADALSAAGSSSQANATQLTAALSTVSTVAAASGVNLPASAAGLQITIINTGANPLAVYPAKLATDTINGQAAATGVQILPGTTAVFNCTAAGAWTVQPASTTMAGFGTNTATSGTTLTAANISGAVASVDLAMTGTLGGGVNAQLPLVSSLLAALHAPTVGTSYRLRIINQSSGNFAWTVTTNTGWGTLQGTMSINQNTWREFVVTITSVASATATLQSVATGTWS